MWSFMIIRVIKSRNMGWAGHVAQADVMLNVHNILVRKPEGKFGRLRHRWVHKIKMRNNTWGCELHGNWQINLLQHEVRKVFQYEIVMIKVNVMHKIKKLTCLGAAKLLLFM
jgi:hypothetical protein